MLGRVLLTFALAAFVCLPAAYAQPPQPQRTQQLETDGAAPAHIARVDGAASLEREGRAENSPLNMPLLSGDRLRTMDGRVEVLFADGSTLHLDANSTIDVQSDDLVRLTEGRLRLNILGPARTVAYRIDSPAGSARITQPGEYRMAFLRGSGETQLEVAVVRGAAEVFTDQGATPVRAGERAYASAGLLPSHAYAYNSASRDAFDRWSEGRRDERLGVSSQYLPSEMQAYAPVLNETGDWRQTESQGYAWYPRVSADWRPYYYGRWDSYPRYGWTWIGADRFAWPTHHYGRWGFAGGAWFWVPASRWAPAYVSWAYAPGYVSWCPLGFDNRPIVALDLYRGSYSPWRAWTAMSYTHFGSRGYSVHQRAVNWDRYAGQRPRFATRSSSPGVARDVAVPRNSAPIRWAGSRDLPARAGETPRYVNRGDEIIRSQTERPTARDTTRTARPDRQGYAIPRASGGTEARPDRSETRTRPEGPARPSRSASTPEDGADVRPIERTRGGSGGVQSPTYQPYQPHQPGGYEPRSAAPAREAAPRQYERSRPLEDQPARRQPMPERAGPERAPSRGEGRQPPAERAAPPSRPSPTRSAPAGGGGVAVPRHGGRGGV